MTPQILFTKTIPKKNKALFSIIDQWFNPKGTAVSPAIPNRFFFKTSAKDIKNTPSILVVQISVIHQLKL